MLVDERVLIERARNGDRDAFAQLYELHIDAVYRYCVYRTRTVSDAEDLTSEVFRRSLASISRYEPNRPFLAFLYTIARNLLTDAARSASNREVRDELAIDAAPGSIAIPEAHAQSKDSARLLQAAIRQLPPAQQEVIVLRFIEEKSYEEVAKLLNRPESTIRGTQMRALVSLRKLMED